VDLAVEASVAVAPAEAGRKIVGKRPLGEKAEGEKAESREQRAERKITALF
jgi:hypothetical protein